MKVYAISVMAFSGVSDNEGNQTNTYVKHLPALQPAASIEQAADIAKNHALGRWKQSEGWYGHQAVIMPVPKSFYYATLDALKAGIVDESEDGEREQVFHFSENLDF
jgi:hypothetical protein